MDCQVGSAQRMIVIGNRVRVVIPSTRMRFLARSAKGMALAIVVAMLSLAIGSASADEAGSGCRSSTVSSAAGPQAKPTTTGFLQWLDSGGEQQVGLAPGSLSQLRDVTTKFVGNASGMCAGLERLQRDWSGLTSAPAGATASEAVGRMLGDMADLLATSGTALEAATSSKIRLAEAIGTVDRHIADDKAGLDAMQRRIDVKRQEVELASRNLTAARDRVNNPTFADRWAQGLSRGGYDPKTENLRRAEIEASALNGQLEELGQRQAELATRSRELQGKLGLLRILANLDTTLTDFQNAANTARLSLSSAHQAYEKAADAKTEGVARYYARRAGAQMKELFEWIETFKSTAAQFACNESRIIYA